MSQKTSLFKIPRLTPYYVLIRIRKIINSLNCDSYQMLVAKRYIKLLVDRGLVFNKEYEKDIFKYRIDREISDKFGNSKYNVFNVHPFKIS